MPDSIGRISVPEVAASGTFPLVTDYPHQRRTFRRVETHRFGSGEGKIEQRFLLGPAVTKYWFQKSMCEPADRAALLAFWEARSGAYQPFTYNAPGDAHGDAATAKTVRFDEPVLTLEHLEMECSAGFWLAELPPSAPAYAVTSTVERFPDAGLSAALLAQEHELIPLLRIRVNEAAVPDITISDRRCVVDGTLYQARLLTFAGVSQAIDGQADDAVFELGNADGVMRDCAADTNLRRALVEFSLYHVGSETLINLWAGRVLADGGWEGETSAVFHLRCSDPIQALNLPYPRRTFSRRCWKRFDDGLNCPYSSAGSLNGSYPSASAGSCDKGWETANGCRAHNMDSYHGGIQQSPQRARIKMPNTGFGFGWGRRSGTVASIIDETVFHGAVVPEVWTNLATAVQGLIVAARDESEFYDALAVISEGPIGAFGSGHRLDGQAHHGPGSLGLRTSLGPNPNTEAFGITGSGDPTPAERAAGTAFIELRRTDAEGIQLTQAEEHSFVAIVSQGLAGWKWTSGTRSSVAGMANPVWVAVNAFLRHLRLEGASAAAQAALFDVAAAELAAGYCDASVAKIVGSGSTTQFTFRGSISEQKPFRDWLTEILANCLGYFTFKFGKLRIGTRLDSVSVEAYTIGNVLFDSLRLTAFPVEATRFVAHFGERLLDAAGVPTTQAENVTAEDEDAAIELGGGAEPLYLEASRNFVGTDTRDQAARLATTRLREMTGGVTAQERARARTASWETTVLGLESEPGQVVGFTEGQIPGGAGEFRVQSWELLPDMRIVIRAKQSYDSMYDLTLGSTAADVEPDALPDESTPTLSGIPGPVTDVEIISVEIDPENPSLVRLTATYEPPVSLEGFDGVEAHLEQPAASEGDPLGYALGVVSPHGWTQSDGAGTGTVIVRTPFPVREERWHLYLLSRNPDKVTSFRHRGDTFPSPYDSVDVDENPGGIEAPNVTGVSLTRIFRALPLRSRSAEFTRTLDYVDAAWTLPTGSPNYSELTHLRLTMVNQTTAEEKDLVVLVVGHAAGQPTKFSIHSFPSPTTPTDFKVRVYAVNRFGRISASPAESAAITMGDIPDAPPVTAPSATPYYQDVGGVPHYGWDFAWTLPTGDADYDEGFDRVEPEGRVVGTGGSWIVFAKEGQGSTGVRTSSQPRQAFGEDWEFRFVSVNPGGVRNVAEAVSVGPITVTAAAGATPGTGFSASRYQAATADGVETWGLQGTVDPQTIGANYQGTEIVGQVYEGNQIAQPSAINNAWWTLSNASVTADAVAAPDGTTTADLLKENSATSTHLAQSTGLSSLADNENYILACHVQRPATNGRHVTLALLAKDGSFTFVRFNSTTGAVLGGGGPLVRSWATDAGGGWWFVGIEVNMASGGTTPLAQIYVAQAGAESYAGDGVSGVYVWHAFVARFDSYEHVYSVTNGLFQTDNWPIANGPFVVWLRAYAQNQYKQRTGSPESVTLFIAPGVTGGLNAARLSPESLGPGLTNTGSDLRAKLGAGLQFSGSDIIAKIGAGLAFSGTDVRVGVAALVNSMLQDGAVTGPKILANSVRAIDAVFQAAAIQNADIANLNVDKLFGALITGLEFELISAPNVMEITGAGGFYQANTSSLREIQIIDGVVYLGKSGQVTAALDGGSSRSGSQSGSAELILTDNSENIRQLFFVLASGMGAGDFRNPSSIEVIRINKSNLGQTNSGHISVRGTAGTDRVELGVDASGNGQIRLNGVDYVPRIGSVGQKIISGSNGFSSGVRAISTGLTSIQSAVANTQTGATPTEYIDGTWSGGTVTFRSSNVSSSAAFSYIIVGTL